MLTRVSFPGQIYRSLAPKKALTARLGMPLSATFPLIFVLLDSLIGCTRPSGWFTIRANERLPQVGSTRAAGSSPSRSECRDLLSSPNYACPHPNALFFLAFNIGRRGFESVYRLFIIPPHRQWNGRP